MYSNKQLIRHTVIMYSKIPLMSLFSKKKSVKINISKENKNKKLLKEEEDIVKVKIL